MAIITRMATIADARLLANLNRAVHEPHVEQQPDKYKPFVEDNPELIAIYEERADDETCFTLIAEEHNAVGYIQCFMREKPENGFVYGQNVCHIDQLAVLETHQGQGIGKLLMAEALRIGKERGAEEITLGVAAFNHNAIKFYEKLGFTVSSHRMSLNINEA